jgi:hypothetical protein
MTVICLAEVFQVYGEPQFRAVGRDLSLNQAKDLVRGCLAEMESVIDLELDRRDATTPERRQVEAVLAALRSAFEGVLTSVRVARPHQHQANPGQPGESGQQYEGQGPRHDQNRNPYQDPYSGQHQGRDQDQYRDRQPRQPRPDTGGGGFSILGLEIIPPKRAQQARPGRPSPGPPDTTVVVISQTLHDQLFSACEAVDRILEAAEPPPEKEEVPWARTEDFLKELLPLLTAYVNHNGEGALDQIGFLEERLRTGYGIEVKTADEETASLFEVHPNSDPLDGTYETRVPAVLVEGQVWRKGEALGPVDGPYSPQADSGPYSPQADSGPYAPQTERGQSHRAED